MDIEPVIATLDTRFDAEESVVIERVLRDTVIPFRWGFTES